MEGLFVLMECAADEGEETEGVCIGVPVKISGVETLCPVTRRCRSLGELREEIQAIEKGLKAVAERAEGLLSDAGGKGGPRIDPHAGAEEIWEILKRIEDEPAFVRSFNGLEEAKRREVAEYVLTRCNVFSGKAALFSSLYDSETARMG